MTTKQTAEIDENDIRIIGHLLEDARKSFVDIGKEIGISKNAVWTRYNKLVASEIITGATTQINYKRLGYDCVGTILLDVDPAHVEEISNYIKTKIPDVFGPFTSATKYNLRAIVTLKTISELANIKEDLRRRMIINEISNSLWTDVWFTPENFTLISVRPIEPKIEDSSTNNLFDADETDLQMIKELTKDSRISFRTLAKKLDISADTVSRRYERLKKNNILLSRIQIDPNKLGYCAMTHFYLRVTTQNNVDSIIKELINTPDIFYIMKCTGDHNIGAMLAVKSIQDMLKTGDRISKIPGIKRTETVTGMFSKKWPMPRTYTSTLSRNLV